MKNRYTFCCLLLWSTLVAQSPSEVFKIMIVPFAKEGASIKELLKNDEHYRIAVNKVMMELENYNYTFVDYLEWLETLNPAVRTRMVSIDVITQEVRNAPADIFIYVELSMKAIPPDESKWYLQFWANDKYSGQRYATSELMSSTQRRWQNFAQALEEIFRDWERPKVLSFFQKFNESLKRVLTEGRNIRVEISRSERSKIPALAPALKQQVSDYLKSFAMSNLVREVGGGPDLWLFEFRLLIHQHSPGELGNKLANFLELKLPSSTVITPMYRSAQINMLIE